MLYFLSWNVLNRRLIIFLWNIIDLLHHFLILPLTFLNGDILNIVLICDVFPSVWEICFATLSLERSRLYSRFVDNKFILYPFSACYERMSEFFGIFWCEAIFADRGPVRLIVSICLIASTGTVIGRRGHLSIIRRIGIRERSRISCIWFIVIGIVVLIVIRVIHLIRLRWKVWYRGLIDDRRAVIIWMIGLVWLRRVDHN